MKLKDLTKSKSLIKLSYAESLQRQLNKCLDKLPIKTFTPMELAIMEGGGSLYEFELPKNQWEMLVSNADKEELGGELVDLVRHAYSNTPQGSFINSIKDVVPSDWKVIDWDRDPDVDATVFYRSNRPGENWAGYKIQGLGHDGTRTSKDKAIAQITQMLNKNGIWIESSDAMRSVLKKLNVPAVTDVELLRKLFNDPTLRMIDDDTYTRKLNHGYVTETVFGKPRVIK